MQQVSLMQLWKSNNRAALADRERATIVTVSLSCALEFSAHLFPPVAPLAHNCWTALMRTLHCRPAPSLVCPSSPLSFFLLPLSRLSSTSLWCHSTACLFLFLFVFFPSRAHLTMRRIHTIMTCDRLSSADRAHHLLTPPLPLRHPLRSPPTH